VVKRRQKTGPAKSASPQQQQTPEVRPAWPAERHSGEGSASALETLQKLEKRRVAARPADPQKE
jgi:hypothetical protein